MSAIIMKYCQDWQQIKVGIWGYALWQARHFLWHRECGTAWIWLPCMLKANGGGQCVSSSWCRKSKHPSVGNWNVAKDPIDSVSSCCCHIGSHVYCLGFFVFVVPYWTHVKCILSWQRKATRNWPSSKKCSCWQITNKCRSAKSLGLSSVARLQTDL